MPIIIPINIDPPADTAAAAPEAPAPPVPPTPAATPSGQRDTVLVFKDGHRLEVSRYSITGDRLFNFSDAGPREIFLSDLDVRATRKANDERGVQLLLP